MRGIRCLCTARLIVFAGEVWPTSHRTILTIRSGGSSSIREQLYFPKGLQSAVGSLLIGAEGSCRHSLIRHGGEGCRRWSQCRPAADKPQLQRWWFLHRATGHGLRLRHAKHVGDSKQAQIYARKALALAQANVAGDVKNMQARYDVSLTYATSSR